MCITWVNLFNWLALTDGNILHCFIALRDDSYRFGYGLGSNGVISRNHDDLDSSTSAFGHSIWDSSSWWINHGHESNKSQIFHREVNIITIKWVSLWELLWVQSEVTKSQHPLSQSTKFHVSIIECI